MFIYLYIYIVYIYIYTYVTWYIHMCLWNPKDSSKHWSHLCEIGLVASHLATELPRSERSNFLALKRWEHLGKNNGTTMEKTWEEHRKNHEISENHWTENISKNRSDISGNRPSKDISKMQKLRDDKDARILGRSHLLSCQRWGGIAPAWEAQQQAQNRWHMAIICDIIGNLTHPHIPSGNLLQFANLKMAIEIVDLPYTISWFSIANS